MAVDTISPTLDKSKHPATATAAAVRRLMPVECERLQGFPDGHTAIVYRGKAAADGPRYRALGNSWAVNCARWLGRRIEAVDSLKPHNLS
jgi:DNA (cytosine-5)-methyltransferase 1